LGLWDQKVYPPSVWRARPVCVHRTGRPPPKANSPPITPEYHIDYTDSKLPVSDKYLYVDPLTHKVESPIVCLKKRISYPPPNPRGLIRLRDGLLNKIVLLVFFRNSQSQVIQCLKNFFCGHPFTEDGVYDLYLEIGDHSRQYFYGFSSPSIGTNN